MDNYPSQTLSDAVDAISSLPGVGRRSALRLALHLLRQPSESIQRFASAIDALAQNAHYCSCCGLICDGEVCPICADTARDHSIICVVESIRDVLSIEDTHQYKGVYHVLGGIISPIDGIGPSDLNIDALVQRCEGAPAVKEVILALSGGVEGETTTFYLYRKLQSTGVKISVPSRGLGFSDDLEYADPLTLGRSIENRQIFKP